MVEPTLLVVESHDPVVEANHPVVEPNHPVVEPVETDDFPAR